MGPSPQLLTLMLFPEPHLGARMAELRTPEPSSGVSMCLTVDLRGLWALTGAQTREPPDRNFPGGPPASPVAEQGVGHLEPSRPVGGKARAVVGKCSAISLGECTPSPGPVTSGVGCPLRAE